MRAARGLGWAAVVGTLVACRPATIRAFDGPVKVEDLDLGYVPVGGTASGAIDVTSFSPGSVQVVSANLPDDPPPGLVVQLSPPLAVLPGGTVRVPVAFSPGAAGAIDVPVAIGLDPSDTEVAHVTATAVDATLGIDPAAIDFGAVSLHSRAVRSLDLANGSPAALAARLALAGGGDFGLATPEPIAIPPHGSATVTLSFTPSTLGAQQATLDVSACPGCAVTPVSVRGTGVAAVVTVTPARLDFGAVRVGQSKSLDVVVANAGNQPLALPAVTIGYGAEVFSVAPSGASQVSAAGSLTLSVTFAPGAAGAFSGALHLATSDPGSPSIDVPLSGSAGAPAIAVLPGALDFGSQPVGSSTVRQVLIENVGAEAAGVPPLQLTGLQLSGSGALFLEGPALPFTLAPGQSLIASVDYLPISGGAMQGTLTVASTDPATPTVTVPIGGGARVPPPCRWSADPSPLDFGLVAPGQSIELDVGLTDVGTDDCVVSGIQAAPGGPFSVPGSPIGPLTLHPGDVFDIGVRFSPTTPGESLGSVQFAVSDPQTPVGRISLIGSAAAGCLAITPPELDFGPTGVACPARSQPVSLTNACSAPVTVASGQIQGLAATDFAISSGALPTTLAPGATAALAVTYAPSPNEPDREPDVAALELDDGEGQPRTVALHGLALQQPTQEDDFTQQTAPKVDILFIMDNSGSFGPQLQAVQDNAGAFLDAAVASGIDFHVGVTTTGIEPATGSWTTCPGGANGGEAGRLFPVDDSSPRILTPQTPNLDSVFGNNVEVGTCHWDERPFDAAVLALTPPLSTSAKAPGTPWPADGNLGFLRQDALLNIIFIQDDDDESVVPNGYTVQSWVDHYVQILRGLKGPGNEWMITASAVTAVQGCNNPADLGVRYFQLVGEMGGSIYSVCTTDWGGTLGQLAAQAFSLRLRFPLSQKPQSPTQITVSVNGQLVPGVGPSGAANWSYDASTGEVVFSPGSAPPAGAQIAITYPTACP